MKRNDRNSLDLRENIIRCRVDEEYMGQVLLSTENLIWHWVHKYIGNPDFLTKNTCMDKDDLLQVGRMGFIKAIKAFDIDRGVKFSSFAVVAIVREIRCYIRDNHNVIRPTRTANDLIIKMRKIEAKLDYLPSPEFMAQILGEPLEKVIKATQVGQQVKYLDEPIKSHTQHTLMDLIEDSKNLEYEIVSQVYLESLIKSVKKVLNDKEKRIFAYRLSGMNQTQVARQENVSQMKVSRVMKKVANIINGL